MTRDPRVRARSPQDALEFVRLTRPRDFERVWARIPEASRRVIETTAKTDWIPLEHDHHISDAWEPVFGEQEALKVLSDSVLVVFESPVLKPVVRGALRLFGATPRALVKAVPKACDHIYRDFYDVRIDTDATDAAKVFFEDIEPRVMQYPSYLFVWRAVFMAMFRLSEHEGTVRLEVTEAARRATYHLEWAHERSRS